MAGGKGGTFEGDVLSLILNNVDAALVGDATGLRGSSTAGSLYVSLHTGTLSASSSQNTNECAYTSYARVAVARSGAAWTVTGTAPASASNASAVTFPKATGGTETATYFAVGTASAGAGKVLYWAPLLSSLAISNNIQPQFNTGTLVITET